MCVGCGTKCKSTWGTTSRTFRSIQASGWERHHIVPRSCNGTNDDVNLVYLSKTDHIKVHGLLSVMCNDPVLSSIFCFMTSICGCRQRKVEIRDIEVLLNDKDLLEELAIARSVHSTNLRMAHTKYKNGDDLNEFETKVRKTCLSLLYFLFIFIYYLCPHHFSLQLISISFILIVVPSICCN